MRVIMTGGGTGGHIYPAIAIADKIKERSFKCEILFVGIRRGLESKIVPEHGYDIRYITASGINRRNLLKNVKTLRDYRKGKKEAKKIIEEFKPDVVIGTGGYVSGAVVKTAASMGIRTYIQEQNAIAGLTNKMLEKHVEKVFLGFEDAKKFFKDQDKLVVSGNPVRNDFKNCTKEGSRQALGIGEDKFVVLSFGGSQGAGRINQAMLDVIKRHNGADDTEVFFGTGKNYYEPILTELNDMGIELEDNIHIMEYIHDMHLYLSACDVVVSRSGAITVAEIAMCGKASILVPSPNVTGDHQTFNARALSDRGGAILLTEEKLKEEVLFDEIEKLRRTPEFVRAMEKQALALAPADATDIIYYEILN